MRTVVKLAWPELAPLWPEFFDNNTCVTPYQSYEFLTLTGKGKPQRQDLFRLIGVKELNLVLYRDDEAVAIAPLLIKKKKGKQIVYFRGHFTTACSLNFLYKPEWTYDDFRFLMDSIRELLGDISFLFDRICEKTETFRYMKEYFSECRIEQHECVSIPVPESHDQWLRGLRKSNRNNIARYMNRLKRENVCWNVDFYQGNAIPGDTYKKMMVVYADRFLVKNNFHFGPLTKPVIKALLMILLKDKVTKFLNSNKASFHGVLYINGKIAAFTSGLQCNNKRISFCRLAIDTKLGRYGPGGILISCTMKHIIEQNQKGLLDVEQMDLAEGGEGGMSYKYAYGGIGYYQYDFVQ